MHLSTYITHFLPSYCNILDLYNFVDLADLLLLQT